MRKKLIGALVVGGGFLVAASVAFAAVVVTLDIKVNKKPGKPTALGVKIVSKDAAGGPLPPIMERLQIRLNSGGQYNSNRFPTCKASPAELTLDVTKCPGGDGFLKWFENSASKPTCRQTCIGSGTGIGWVAADVLPETQGRANAKLAIFNGSKQGGKPRILVFVYPDIGQTFVSPGTVTKRRQGKFDYLLDFQIPPIPVVPGIADGAVGTVDTNTPIRKVKKGRKTYHLIVAPKKCTGKWVAQGKFFFRGNDPPPYTTDISQPCTRSKKK